MPRASTATKHDPSDSETPREPRTAWVADSVGPALRLAAKSARMLLERRLARVGSSFGTWVVLATLEAAGPLVQRELARRLGIEGATLTRHLERMEAAGLIVRDRSGSDRRYALVELTPDGRALCQHLDAEARAANAQLLDGLADEDVAQLKDTLAKLIINATAG